MRKKQGTSMLLTNARLALHGPPLSGKTTVSRYLTAHGFTHVNFTQYLKILGVEMFAAAGKRITVEDMEMNKALYRPWLQHTGTILGFDKGFGVVDSLFHYEGVAGESAPAAYPPPLKPFLAFDNVRSQAQFDVLRDDFGFILVRLHVSREEQLRRAETLGYNREKFLRTLEHPIETPLPWQENEIPISGELPVERIWNVIQATLALRAGINV